MSSAASAPDFLASCHGSLWLIDPQTPAAVQWLEEHVGEEATYWCDALVCETRYVSALAAGIQDAGLTIG
jgi:hypothetical protein